MERNISVEFVLVLQLIGIAIIPTIVFAKYCVTVPLYKPKASDMTRAGHNGITLFSFLAINSCIAYLHRL
jgi:hypothetical protein